MLALASRWARDPCPARPSFPAQACPLTTFLGYWRAREAGLPLGAAEDLDINCSAALAAMVGGAKQWAVYKAAGLAGSPELVNLAAAAAEGYWKSAAAAAAGEWNAAPRADGGNGAPAPVAAWAPVYNASADAGPPRAALPLECQTVKLLQAQFEAYEWLKANMSSFPIVSKGPWAPQQPPDKKPQ